MSGQDQVTIMSSRANGGSGATSTSAARVILQTSGPQTNKIASQQGPPPLTSIVLSTSAASKMLGQKDYTSPSSKVAELSSTKHRVKQLLETYSMTAEKSLMGPEEAAYSKFDQSYSGGGKSAYSSSSYKLLPDVEISKTNNPHHPAEVLRREDVIKHLTDHGSIASNAGATTSTENGRLYLNKRIPAAILSQPHVSVRQDLVDNEPGKQRDAPPPQNHQQMVSPAIAAAAAAMSANFHQNGLVTLSKIENPLHRSIQQQSQNHGTSSSIDQRQAYMAVLQQQQALRENRAGDSRSQRIKSDGSEGDQVPAMSPLNGGSNGGIIMGNGGGSARQHLTGEMIRQLRQHKEKAQAVGLLGGAKNTAVGGGDKHQFTTVQQQQMQAATYAAIQQHQMQMHAVYERALKEKSYLRNTTGHPSATAVSGSAKNSNAYADQQVTTSAVDKLSSQSSFKPPGATAGQMPPLSPISPVDISRVGHLRINSSTHGGGQMGPVLSTRTDLHNPGHAKLQSTKLAGRGNIACFYIGGEARCCLPLILNSILDQISLHAINLSCDELQIYCSTCTPEQMDVLKNAAIIPISASQCGLITKSDAERLVSMLLDRNPPLASLSGFRAKSSPFSFRVEHSCFGDARGIVLPEAYTNATARCIECLECEGLFCPQKFVCHSHNPKNRTCHWGFDSDNWRSYLHIAEDYTDSEQEKLSKIVADFKNRYKPTSTSTTITSKRKTTDTTATNSSTIPQSQHHPIGRHELISPSGPRQQNLSSPASTHQSKFHSQHETLADISPTKKPRLSEINQAHDGALQLHSIRSSTNSHQSNIPPLEPVHADGRYHASSSSTGGENLGRDGNRTEPQYSMYVYQQWAKLNPEAAANSHPPNASDLITRVGKDGKGSSVPGYSGGHRQNHRSMTDDDPLPPGKRVSSLDRATTSGVAGLRSPNASSTTRGTPDGPRSISAERAGSSFRDSRIRGNGGSGHLSGLHVKSSPVSSVGDYSPTGKVTPQDISTGDRLLPSDADRRRGDNEELINAGGRNYARRNSGKEGRTSLAEDIHSIRIALNGASTTAKERTLKTLERLTARLALAESERDVALGELHDLQKRFRKVEDELQKKRAELREALRQDTIPTRSGSIHSPSESIGSRGGSAHRGYSADHHVNSESTTSRHLSSSRGYNGPVRSQQVKQTETNYRRYNNHNPPPPALTRSGVTLELLSPNRGEENMEYDDQYRHGSRDREDVGAELIRTESPSRPDSYMASPSGYHHQRSSSSSHLSRSHNRHIRRNSGNDYERRQRSGSDSNYRSRSGSRESDNIRHPNGRPTQISARESHVLRPSEISASHKIGLPKIDLKSPARVIEEKEPSPTIEDDTESQHNTRTISESCRAAAQTSNEDVSYEDRRWEDSRSSPPLPRLPDHKKRGIKESNLREASLSPEPNQDLRQVDATTLSISQSIAAERRNSSGTPVSVKSKESEDVLDRMKSMEAELRALRNELSNRSSNSKKTQPLSSAIQNMSEDLDDLSDNNHGARKSYDHCRSESPDPNADLNEDTDTSLEERKLSIDLDKDSPQNRCEEEDGKADDNDYEEEESFSIHQNLQKNNPRRDNNAHKILISDPHSPISDYPHSNGRPNKQRNGGSKISDNNIIAQDKDEGYRETDSETPSTTYSREQDDEVSRSPVEPPVVSKQATSKTESCKTTFDEGDSSPQAFPSSNHKTESNGNKVRNSIAGISRDLEKNPSVDRKTVVQSDPKHSNTSSKTIVTSKKAPSHLSVAAGPQQTVSNRLHKSTKLDINSGKDKTE